MAAPTAADVLVSSPLATGGVLTAPTGSTLPTDATTALDIAFVASGYVTEDGVTVTINKDTEDIFAWGGDKVRVIQTSHSAQIKLAFLESNEESLGVVFGADNVTVTGDATVVKINSNVLPHFALVLDMKDGDKRARVAAADVQVIEQGDMTFSHSDATGYEVTLECFPDSSNNKAYIYLDADGAVA